MNGNQTFVLLVEDDDQLRKIITQNLRARGYFVLQAGSFREAIDSIAIKPQVAILDIQLPDATGWDVARWLESVAKAVPTIVISGYRPDREELRRVKPALFLPKPFAIGELMTHVDAYAKMSPVATERVS